ncbi:MAG TPA: hypothetical protein DF699_14035, partial [Phycisphaerales bacterium]|nr:hypothetical protein [Phycisphaerales bacterium]
MHPHRRHANRFLISSALLSMLAGSAMGAQPRTLDLKTGPVRVNTLTNMLSPNQVRPQLLPERMVMVLDGPMSPERRQKIEATGVAIGDYLPTNAFV